LSTLLPYTTLFRSHPCNFYHGYRSRSSYRDNQPDQSREREARKRRQFQNKSMLWPEMANHTKGQQEYSRRNRSQRDQGNINGAMQPLFTAAALAAGEVLVVVAAHLRRKAGNVVAPAGQNVAYDRIDALTHRSYNRIASIATDCVASITRL